MAFLKLIFSVFIVFTIVVIGLVFGFRNSNAIPVDFLAFQSSSMGIGFWILLSFVVGVIFGWSLSLPKGILLKVSNHYHQRKLKSQADELSRLKGLPLKGK